MKIFISWSGDVSKYVAEALQTWLKDVIHSLSPWISSRNIEAGSFWSIELAQQLRDTNFGVICLTRSNLTAPWLLFEAGALAKQIVGGDSLDGRSSVCPYLIGGLRPADLPQKSPWPQFQYTESTEEGTKTLLNSINSALTRVEPDNAYESSQLNRAFERWWPDLRARLNTLPSDEVNVVTPMRSESEMMEEILDLVRRLVRGLEPWRGGMQAVDEAFPDVHFPKDVQALLDFLKMTASQGLAESARKFWVEIHATRQKQLFSKDRQIDECVNGARQKDEKK